MGKGIKSGNTLSASEYDALFDAPVSDQVEEALTNNGLPADKRQFVMAQLRHETGEPDLESNVALKNNNVSGITWNENFPEEWKGTPRGQSEGGNYVHFPTYDDWAKEHLKLLHKDSGAGAPIDADKIEDYAHRLKKNGYYRASEAEYTNGLKNMLNQYGRKPVSLSAQEYDSLFDEPAENSQKKSPDGSVTGVADNSQSGPIGVLGSGATQAPPEPLAWDDPRNALSQQQPGGISAVSRGLNGQAVPVQSVVNGMPPQEDAAKLDQATQDMHTILSGGDHDNAPPEIAISNEIDASKRFITDNANNFVQSLPPQAADLLRKQGLDLSAMVPKITSSVGGEAELATYYKTAMATADEQYRNKKAQIMQYSTPTGQETDADFDAKINKRNQDLAALDKQHQETTGTYHNAVFNLATTKAVNRRLQEKGLLSNTHDGFINATEQQYKDAIDKMSPDGIGREVMATMGDKNPGDDTDPAQKVQREQIGYQAMKYAMADAYASGNTKLAKALKEKTDNANAQILEDNPEYKKKQVANAISQKISSRANTFKNFMLGTGADKAYIDATAKEMGIPAEDYKDVQPGDITNDPGVVMKATGGLLKPLVETAQFGANLAGDKDDQLTNWWNNNAVGKHLGWNANPDNSVDITHGASITDTNPQSPTYLQSIKNPKAGKFNLGWNSIGSEVVGGISTMAGMALGSGELGEALQTANLVNKAKIADRVGLGIYSYITGYDKNYQAAKQAIGDNPNDESKRIGLANLYTAVDALALQILPAKDVADKWIETPAAKEFVDLVQKKGIDNVTAEMAKPFIVRGLKEGGKDLVKGVSAGVLNQLGNNAADMAFAPQKYAQTDVRGDVEKGAIIGAIQMLIPTVGGGLMHAAGMGPMQKKALYEMGTNSKPFIDDINRQMAAGTLSKEDGAAKLAAINSIASAYKSSVPKVSPSNGESLTQKQQEDYGANVITEQHLQQQHDATQDKVQQKVISNKIRKLQDERGSILDAAGEQPSDNDNTIKINELTGKNVLHKGEPATIETDEGGEVSVTNKKTGKSYVLGQAEKIGVESAKQHGVEETTAGSQPSVVSVNDAGNISVRGKEYAIPEDHGDNPIGAINYHNAPGKKGIPISVTLDQKTAGGGIKKVTFRGDVAEDIMYQLHLKKLDKDNSHKKLEDFINTDEEVNKKFQSNAEENIPLTSDNKVENTKNEKTSDHGKRNEGQDEGRGQTGSENSSSENDRPNAEVQEAASLERGQQGNKEGEREQIEKPADDKNKAGVAEVQQPAIAISGKEKRKKIKMTASEAEEKIPITKKDEYRAWDQGTTEGKPEAEVKKQIEEAPHDQKIGGGESFIEFKNRIKKAWENTKKTAQDQSLLMTHSSVMNMIEAANQHGWDDNDLLRETYNDSEQPAVGEKWSYNTDKGQIHVMRHGESKDGAAGNTRTKETPLTPKGKTQAKEDIAGHLKDEGITPPEIITDTQPRTTHTAEIVRHEMGADENNDNTFIDKDGKKWGIEYDEDGEMELYDWDQFHNEHAAARQKEYAKEVAKSEGNVKGITAPIKIKKAISDREKELKSLQAESKHLSDRVKKEGLHEHIIDEISHVGNRIAILNLELEALNKKLNTPFELTTSQKKLTDASTQSKEQQQESIRQGSEPEHARTEQAGSNTAPAEAKSSNSDVGSPKEEKVVPVSTAEQNRKKGSFVQDGITYDRNKKQEGPTGNSGTIEFSRGIDKPYTFQLIEAGQLQPSSKDGNRNPNHFIPEAQPKERTDAASKESADRIADKPDLGKVGEAPNPYSGAPVVNARGEIIQGNNRGEGLIKHYGNNGESYKNQLIATAEKFGFTKDQIDGMQNPVLVRRIEVGDEEAIKLGNYHVKDIETGGKNRIDPVATSQRISLPEKQQIVNAIIKDGEDRTLNQSVRDNFDKLIKLLKSHLRPAQLDALTNKSGEPSSEGLQDVEKLITHFLFDGGDVNLPNHFEGLSDAARKGLIRAFPKIFSVSDENSLLPEVQNALIAHERFSTSGNDNFNSWKISGDMFTGRAPAEIYTPLELKIAETLFKTTKQAEIKNLFASYAEKVNGKEGDMFGGKIDPISKVDAIKEVFKTTYDEKQSKIERQKAESERIRAEADRPPVREEAESEEPAAKPQQKIETPEQPKEVPPLNGAIATEDAGSPEADAQKETQVKVKAKELDLQKEHQSLQDQIAKGKIAEQKRITALRAGDNEAIAKYTDEVNHRKDLVGIKQKNIEKIERSIADLKEDQAIRDRANEDATKWRKQWDANAEARKADIQAGMRLPESLGVKFGDAIHKFVGDAIEQSKRQVGNVEVAIQRTIRLAKEKFPELAKYFDHKDVEKALREHIGINDVPPNREPKLPGLQEEFANSLREDMESGAMTYEEAVDEVMDTPFYNKDGEKMSEAVNENNRAKILDYLQWHDTGKYRRRQEQMEEARNATNKIKAFQYKENSLTSEYLGINTTKDVFGDEGFFDDASEKKARLVLENVADDARDMVSLYDDGQKPITEWGRHMLDDAKEINDPGKQVTAASGLSIELQSARVKNEKELIELNKKIATTKNNQDLLAQRGELLKERNKITNLIGENQNFKKKLLSTASDVMNRGRLDRMLRNDMMSEHYEKAILSDKERKAKRDLENTLNQSIIDDYKNHPQYIKERTLENEAAASKKRKETEDAKKTDTADQKKKNVITRIKDRIKKPSYETERKAAENSFGVNEKGEKMNPSEFLEHLKKLKNPC